MNKHTAKQAARQVDAGTLTYDPELVPGYFTQIRSDFVRFPGFPPTVKILYIVLLSYAAAGAVAWPGQKRLAAECGVSVRTIQTTLDTLEAAELIVITRRGLNLTNLYHVRKLPTVLPVLDTQILRIQKRKICASESATVAHELYTVELDSEKTDPPPPTPAAIERHTPVADPVVVDQRQVQEAATVITERIGLDSDTAAELAQLAAGNGHDMGYVNDLADYVLTTPGLDNPAGVFVSLVKGNKQRRRGPASTPRPPRPVSAGAGLDSSKYHEGGKYAHLFNRPNNLLGGEHTDAS